MSKSIRPKILVVDDMPDMRLVLRLALERMGWSVIEAGDGTQAIEVAQGSSPDLILMDYNMPKLNGVDACRALKNDAATAHMAIIIYTGAYANGLIEQALEAGASDFLTKPILPSDLRQKVSDIYEKYCLAMQGSDQGVG